MIEPSKLPRVDVTGPPAVMGASYALQCRDMITRNLDLYAERFRSVGVTTDLAAEIGRRFMTAVQVRYPRIATMITAMADTLERPAEELFALQGRSEILMWAALTASSDGCTALAVQPQRARSRTPILAQNWDWHPDQQRVTLVLSTIDECGHAAIVLTEAGMLAKCGLSSAGVALCVNILAANTREAPAGIPYHVILRAIIEAPTFGEALAAAAAPERTAAMNLLIGDSTGQAVDLELAGNDTGWLAPTDGLLTHANHYESELAAVDVLDRRGADIAMSSRCRGTQARRQLDDSGRALELADVKAVLRSHSPEAICVHPNATAPRDTRTATLASVILEPHSGTVHVAAGPPCEHEYVEMTVHRSE